MESFRILVVDDEPMVRLNIQRWLIRRGHDADVAADGREALDRVLAHATGYHAIVMDIEMPGMGGVEATRLIREVDQKVPIVAVTGYTDFPHRIIEAGASIIMAKPFRFNDLENEIIRVIERES